MNAPTNFAQLEAKVSLEDKYILERGQAFMSGVQALVRLPLLQRQRDVFAGKNTAGLISGYRGSPLGTYDQALWAAKKHLKANEIVFQPGVNEELAATALWGTQQLGFAPERTQRYDGVFGIWYGKGPGVDRCADVFKHANMAGTTPWGGVLAVAGDDHMSKSSTAAHQSDHIFKACGLPVFFPSSVQEILDLGLHALAMSRFAGIWTGMKTIQEIVESSTSVEMDLFRTSIVLPEFEMPPGGLHIRWPDDALSQEARLLDYKWYAALAYVRANRLNQTVISGPSDRLGLIASGKAYNDTRQALFDLGLDEATCQRIGLRLHKVSVVWPLEAQLTREFATGLQEILVVEEKRQIIEYQLKEELYNWRSDVRPNVLGKFNDVGDGHPGGEWSMTNPSGNTLLRANADLNPALIARAIAGRLLKLGVDAGTAARMQAHLAVLDAQARAVQTLFSTPEAAKQSERQPWFCSGCPHSISTQVPEGSRAMAGIGCHFMVLWMDRRTLGFTHMGGEGVPWVGQQPFTDEKHVFANLGDGTYFHSGILAVRQTVAAGVNITYKLLYNDAVAMTGGQTVGERPEGHSVLQMAHSLMAEGVKKIVVLTDEPEKYENAVCTPGFAPLSLPPGVPVLHRDELDRVQRELRQIQGTTILIYDQTCATEKRRRRKRGLMVDPAVRTLINPQVCEGCGDCGVQSNCLSIEPLETTWGRKRSINQSSCNKDLSCVKGFCPSFVTVKGGRVKKPGKAQASTTPNITDWPELPEPVRPDLQAHAALGAWGVVVAGVGGTGVITVGQLLGVAAHIEGLGVVTQDAAGLAQKGGATWSHVLLAATRDEIRTTRVNTAAADLILGCDPVVTASQETLQRLRPGRSHVVLNTHAAPTAAFVQDGAWTNPAEFCIGQIAKGLGEDLASADSSHFLARLDAHRLATALLGDSIYVNPMVLGFAWQKGWLPLKRESLLQAMQLNGVAVAQNQLAFEWGRRCAHDAARVQSLLVSEQVLHFKKALSLDEIVAERVAELTRYQNAAYAKTYAERVEAIRRAEAAFASDQNSAENSAASSTTNSAIGSRITSVFARNLFKLMAYKDEYEVARLHSDPTWVQSIAQQFEGQMGRDYQLQFHLAPPLWAKKDAQGHLQKQSYGSWVMPLFKLLSHGKFLRGTRWDPFGCTEERRAERALIARYWQDMQKAMARLNADNQAQVLALAQLPEAIKGFGHVKARNWHATLPRWEKLLQDLGVGA